MTDLARVHRRLLIVMGLAALVAFLSGAGLTTPLQAVALGALLLGAVWQPSPRTHERLEWVWRIAALALAGRAILMVLTTPEDVVLPMVDVLLALLASEALRPAETSERTRMYTVTFALMVGAAAYRAGIMFGIAFIVYSMAATVALMLGHVLRESQRFGAKSVPLSRGFLWKVASLSSVMLLMSGLLFLAFPRVTRNWVSRGQVRSEAIVGFSDRVSLAEHGSRIYPNPEVVLRVEFASQLPPAGRALYWRGRSYDFFDGTAWWHSPRARSLSVSPQQYAGNWGSERLRPKIYGIAMNLPVLFALHPTLEVRPLSRMRSIATASGDLWFDGTGPPIYQISAPAAQPRDPQLAAARTVTLPPDAAYLQLPPLSSAVYALADSLTRDQPTQLAKARAVERYLHSFHYTLELPPTAREATLEHFLFRRRAGHCEYFSTAMALLLRAAGIPARNVNGFVGGEWNQFGSYLTVTQNQAHSWVEVWFPVYGWVTFDPTPASTGDIAEAQSAWWASLRFLVDGLEHRWNKWVIEYNLDTQMDLFRRAADALAAPETRGAAPRPQLGLRGLAPVALVGFMTVLLVGLWRWRATPSQVVLPETRQYLKLRRAYQRAGWADSQVPPLRFLELLRERNAPAVAESEAAVDLYLRSRFGAEQLSAEDLRRIVQSVDLARRALRSRRSDA